MQFVRLFSLAASMIAAPAFAQDEPSSWRFAPGDGYAAAVLTNCDECDYIEMIVQCEQGSGTVDLTVALDVEDGSPGDERGITFMFGDGAIDHRAVLVANEMDATTEPSVTLAADDELLVQMRDYVAEPQIAVSDAEKKAIAEATSMEVMVELGPNKTVSLKGAHDALGQLLPLCQKGG